MIRSRVDNFDLKGKGHPSTGIVDEGPSVNKSCRVCKQLESEGFGEKFYEDHLSVKVTGCPLWIKMSIDERWDLLHKAKICGRCLDHETIVGSKAQLFNHFRSCKGPGSEYSCEGDTCRYHMWVCKGHRERNSSRMNDLAKDFQTLGLTLGMFNIPVISNTAQNSLNQQTTIEKAISQLVRKERQKPGCRWVNKPPEGSPLFIFTRVKGKKNGANLFFDKGCGTALFRLGIPGVELEGVRIARGKIPIGGVGGIEIFAEEDWLVSLERTDGQRQLVQGLAVQSVTVDFPFIDTSEAVYDLKANSANDWVRNCVVPKNVGGVTDGLIGIQYDLIHPEPIHTLPSGLTLYRSRLATHDPGINAAIGGPHESFDFCCQNEGGAARVVTLFAQQIERYRNGEWTAPKVTTFPMSVEELKFAKEMNEKESGHLLSGLVEVERGLCWNEDLFVEIDHQNKSASNENSTAETGIDGLPDLSCNLCGLTVVPEIWSEEVADVLGIHEDKIKSIKEKWSQLQIGLDTEYRCPKCRDCIGCKNSEQSEKVSIREEAEMQLIEESVCLDWKNNRIICSLPVRGEERDFLSSNKEQALKILDQQCRKWHKDQVNKPLILAAFEKLFRTGDTKFVSQMTQEELSKFINKEVQFFIPWRIVFQDSVTTPIRPVLDGSSNTKVRPDGSGGRNLNDFVVKGRISTLNLLRLLLRFSIGLHAVTGDLSQFYYSCKLREEQWNLQRFLFREGLNPDGQLLEGVIGALIYGVKCVSAQTECAIEKIATVVENEHPELATFLRQCRYVNDLGESNEHQKFLSELTANADVTFEKIGLRCKGWTRSGDDPPEDIAKSGATVSIAGQRWLPKVDCIEVPIPDLHFGTRRRGRVDERVPRFSGVKEDIDRFVPIKLTRRKIASKVASIYDLLGKLSPIFAGLKADLSNVVKTTSGWDDIVSSDIRSKWVEISGK